LNDFAELVDLAQLQINNSSSDSSGNADNTTVTGSSMGASSSSSSSGSGNNSDSNSNKSSNGSSSSSSSRSCSSSGLGAGVDIGLNAGGQFHPGAIIKQKFSKSGKRKYLMQWVNCGDDLSWENADSYEGADWLWLVQEWEHNCKTPGVDNSDSESSESEDEQAEVASRTIWCKIGNYTLTLADKNILEKGLALPGNIMDLCMWMLAGQTKNFQFNSCCCPLVGYESVVNEGRGHIQVHFCGTDYEHWVASFLEWTTQPGLNNNGHTRVWTTSQANDHRFTPKVLTEMTDLYFTARPKDSYDDDIRVIPCEQKLPSSCGYVSIALCVEIAMETTALANLSQLRLDEKKANKWLLQCIANKKFVRCPMLPAVQSAQWCFQIKISQDFIKDKGKGHTTQRTPSTGHGNKEGNYGLPKFSPKRTFETAPSQVGKLRLMPGCEIQFSYDDSEATPHRPYRPVSASTVGMWTVTNVSTNGTVTIKSKSRRGDGTQYRIAATSRFRILAPPILRVMEFHTIDRYVLLGNSTKIQVRLVYPVRENRLSNAMFARPDATRYEVFEIVRCETNGDIRSTLNLLQGKMVQCYTRLQDLIPWHAVAKYRDKNREFDKFKVEGTGNFVQEYWEKVNLMAAELNIKIEWMGEDNQRQCCYQEMADLGVAVCRPKQIGFQSPENDIQGTLPCHLAVETSVSGHMKTFQSGEKTSSVHEWGKHLFQGQQCNWFVICLPAIPDDQIIRTMVVEHSAIYQHVGRNLNEAKSDLLKLVAAGIVETMSIKQSETSGGWKAYSFDVAVDLSGTSTVVRVGKWETSREIQTSNELLTWGGLMAIGGNKMVMKGALSSGFSDTDRELANVAIYRPRQPNDPLQLKLFRNDIDIHKWLSTHSLFSAGAYFLKMIYSETTTPGWEFAVTELMEQTLRSGIKQWKLNLRKKVIDRGRERGGYRQRRSIEK
jgi:hypothetical protein